MGGSQKQLGSYFGVQVEKLGSSHGREKWLDSGQVVLVSPLGSQVAWMWTGEKARPTEALGFQPESQSAL